MEWVFGVTLFLVISGTLAYGYLLFFHPEWVGITGKSAKKTLEEHKQGSQVDDSDPFSSRKKENN